MCTDNLDNPEEYAEYLMPQQQKSETFGTFYECNIMNGSRHVFMNSIVESDHHSPVQSRKVKTKQKKSGFQMDDQILNYSFDMMEVNAQNEPMMRNSV